MDQLVAALRAALDEDERIAREACDGSSGGWFVGRKNNVYRVEDENPQGDEEHALVVWGNISVQSDHIERQDPKRTLAMVAAHRKILELHEHVAVDGIDFDNGFGCGICATSQLWGTLTKGWCATVTALAKGYGIEES